ncbi:MAG: DUF456 family protein [Gemmatimonadaceae bacterium]|jgi:hypothetical protein|nr:DUF456 family protein [Gemmatimonadaceae bacterium]
MTVATLLLVAAVLAGLALVALGLPGLWLMIFAGVGHRLLVSPPTLSWGTLALCAAIAAVAEVVEFRTSAGYARRYGGSRRASWGAIAGGLAGAMLGVPVPVIGSVIGAFAGAFAGALVAEYTLEKDALKARQVAMGAMIGRAVATAQKAMLGLVVGVWLVAAAWA